MIVYNNAPILNESTSNPYFEPCIVYYVYSIIFDTCSISKSRNWWRAALYT